MKDIVLLTGSTGFLGHYLLREFSNRKLAVVSAGRTGCDVRVDLDDPDSLLEIAVAVRPRYVVNAAAMSSIAACQEQPARAQRINGGSPRVLASSGCRFLQLSTDLVFAGDEAPYGSCDRPRPLSSYGESKLAGENLEPGDWVVARLPLLFGRSFDGRRGASDTLRLGVSAGERPLLYRNEYRTPLHAADAAKGIADLLLDQQTQGIRHLAGHERVSRWEFGQRFCAAADVPSNAILPGLTEDPQRPRDVSLEGEWRPSRGLDTALSES